MVEERISRPLPEEEDFVEVIEEHSPERPVRKSSKRMSGFRTIDPTAPRGGNEPMRGVSRN